ncbi:hypothetical protein GJ634_02925 [Halobacterium sp. CBA1126]|nr:hypothetical protein [Halobacterium sp. CBA1126]
MLPSVAVPQSVEGVDADVEDGGLLMNGPTLRPGDSYVVESRRPVGENASLANATGEAPDRVAATYGQLPDSTDDRVVDLAASLTDGAESNYERAAAIERWLEANKAYSLDAPRPDGDLVTEFVLGDAPGYCTYFASAMAVMLRSQGVPARFVTGFTPGQQVADDEWVVRGLDSPRVGGGVRARERVGALRPDAERRAHERGAPAGSGGPRERDRRRRRGGQRGRRAGDRERADRDDGGRRRDDERGRRVDHAAGPTWVRRRPRGRERGHGERDRARCAGERRAVAPAGVDVRGLGRARARRGGGRAVLGARGARVPGGVAAVAAPRRPPEGGRGGLRARGVPPRTPAPRARPRRDGPRVPRGRAGRRPRAPRRGPPGTRAVRGPRRRRGRRRSEATRAVAGRRKQPPPRPSAIVFNRRISYAHV